MLFNKHLELTGLHAFLSPSKYHWMNYDDEKLDRVYSARLASARGTALHEFALSAIELGVKLPDSPKTLHLYVNDCIGYRMIPEQMLYYSPNSFGTADAVSFRNDILRIFDLKTGLHPCSVHQLEVYAALFCLEYRYQPTDFEIDLRIYQNDDVKKFDVDRVVISHIMERIVTFDKRINELRLEVHS
jgi:hypothetical protein